MYCCIVFTYLFPSLEKMGATWPTQNNLPARCGESSPSVYLHSKTQLTICLLPDFRNYNNYKLV